MPAEKMPDDVLVEAIFRQIAFPREKPELMSWDKRQKKALYGAMGAIALDNRG